MRGGDRCRFELAKALLTQGRADYHFLGYEHLPKALGVAANPQLLTTHIRPHQHPQAEIFEHITLPMKARRRGIDIYHGTFNVLPWNDAAKIQLVTVHDMAVFDFPEGYGSKFGMYMRALIKRAMHRARVIVAVSSATRDKIIERFPELSGKIRVIMNGVGHEFLDIAEHAPPEVRPQIAHLASNPYILFVGNLEPKKNLVRLIEAFVRFKARYELPHELLIVGEKLPKGPGSGLSADLLQAAHDVKFLGYLPDELLPALYRAASLIAYPSLYEGFGMPVLEGLAAGVPVLTSRVSSLPEVAGGHACLVDPLDVEGMSVAMRSCLEDDAWRSKAIEGGLNHARSLTWQVHARATEDLYFELFANRAARERPAKT